jgi:hypothetical protein
MGNEKSVYYLLSESGYPGLKFRNGQVELPLAPTGWLNNQVNSVL